MSSQKPSITIFGVHDPKMNSGFFVGSYNAESFPDALDYFMSGDILDLLIRAVNNRTIERNYFRLYSQLLEGNISEDCFDKEIEEHENDYVIETGEKPSLKDINIALHLAPRIKNINNSTDLSTLFSFDPDETDKLIALPEISNGNL